MKPLIVALFTLLSLSSLTLSGCSEPTTGPVEVRWDRDSCERCRMALSDRKHSAQIRFINEKKKSVVHKFDDIGCAVIWLEDKLWSDASSTEIWVNDHTNGDWINAKTAYYIKGHVTPMEFGLGAQQLQSQDAMSFTDAKKQIFTKEASTNMHGDHNHHH